MEEILALQRQLMMVQETKPRKTLTERNTMEILDFLKKQHHLVVISTLDGKEFMTLSELDHIIYETCLNYKKLRISELESLLNINSSLIESRVEILEQKYKLTMLNNQLITKEYILMLFDNIEDRLKNQKICRLADIALENDIDISFLKKFVLDPKYQSLIHIDYEFDERSNYLLSKKFYDLLRKKVRGFLNGLIAPVKIDDMVEKLKIDKYILSNFLANSEYTLENDLILSKNFLRLRDEKIKQAFVLNGMLDLTDVKKNYKIPKPKQYIENLYKDVNEDDKPIFLVQTVIHVNEFAKILIGCEQSLKYPGYLQLDNITHITLPKTDYELLIKKILNQLAHKNLSVYFEGSCIVLNQWIQKNIIFLETELKKQEYASSKIDEKLIKDILIKTDKMDYNEDKEMSDFLIKTLFSRLDVKKIKKETSKKTQPKHLANKADINKEKIDVLMKRVDDITTFYQLYEKSIKDILKKCSQDVKPQIEMQLRNLSKIVVENIIILILRKFSHPLNFGDYYDFESFTSFSSLFKYIFVNDEVGVSHFEKLPADIKNVFYMCIDNKKLLISEPIEKNKNDKEKNDPRSFHVLDASCLNINMLLKKGSEITIGNKEINKKQEKSFLVDLSTIISDDLNSNIYERDPEEAIGQYVLLLAVRYNMPIFYDYDIEYAHKVLTDLKNNDVTKCAGLYNEVLEILERYEVSLDWKFIWHISL